MVEGGVREFTNSWKSSTDLITFVRGFDFRHLLDSAFATNSLISPSENLPAKHALNRVDWLGGKDAILSGVIIGSFFASTCNAPPMSFTGRFLFDRLGVWLCCIPGSAPR